MLPFSARRICLFLVACLLVAPTVSASSTGGAWAPVPEGGGVAAEPQHSEAETTGATPAQAEDEEEVPEGEGEGEGGEGEGEDDGEVVIPVPVPEDDDEDTTAPEEPAPAPIVRDQGFSLPSTGRELIGPAATALLFLVAGAALARHRRA